MKQMSIVIILLLLGISYGFSQVIDAPEPGFEDVQISIAPEDLEIQIKALMPDISMVKIKTDTYAQPGIYKFTINLGAIQKESKEQLTNWQQQTNKWLEESK